MKKTICIAVALAIALTLAACGRKEMTSGIVIDKYYRPERSWTTHSVAMVGKVTIPRTHHHHEDESWNLVIAGKRGEQYECMTVQVSEGDYNQSEIGGKWSKLEK